MKDLNEYLVNEGKLDFQKKYYDIVTSCGFYPDEPKNIASFNEQIKRLKDYEFETLVWVLAVLPYWSKENLEKNFIEPAKKQLKFAAETI